MQELDRELEMLSAIHYDIECEIEELIEKRKRFVKKWKAILPRKVTHP